MTRKLFGGWVLLLVGVFWESTVYAKPTRIASLNLCTDQVLLMLVEPHRIASVTHLAAQKSYSSTWQLAQGIPPNRGLAEQVIHLNPDLILASPYTPGSAVLLLKDLGFPIEVVTIPNSLADIEAFVNKMGELVGETKRATILNEQLQQSIAQAAATITETDQPRALVYAPNGHTAGVNTLKNDILEASGYGNLAADLGIENYGNLSIEQLLFSKPDTVIIDDSTFDQNSLAQKITNHPALRRAFSNTQMVAIESNQWLCAGPMAALAISYLNSVRLETTGVLVP